MISNDTPVNAERRRRNCLYCYEELAHSAHDFHVTCSQKMFGKPTPPDISLSTDVIRGLVQQFIQTRQAVGGAQPKLSLSGQHASQHSVNTTRLTLIGINGDFIVKPQNHHYPYLPEVEDLTMHLAETTGLPVVPHSLLRLGSGELAYITRRIDRYPGGVYHMEDMCQLTGRLTADKYKGSYEQIGKIIQKYSDRPGIDLVRFAELLVFCYLTGNADMHLKNFSLVQKEGNTFVLAPAYDLVNTTIMLPSDTEELALTLNGRKSNLNRFHFETAFTTMGLTTKQQAGILRIFYDTLTLWKDIISKSFLPYHLQNAYREVIERRHTTLFT